MNSTIPSSPYVGLRPFEESDFAYFFGREREIRVIASNLQARPLTVLYGSSGVGKSSVLQAGVLRRLKQNPEAPVLYFRDWQSDSLLNEILQQASRFAPPAADAGDSAGSSAMQSEQANPPADAAPQRAFLLLDQFEEFLLYHASDSLGEEFDSVLSRIVNRKDCPVNVLIGIRDDSLFKLDRRFSLRIPNLLRDTLELERMTPTGARSSIEKPLAVYSRLAGNGHTYDVEPQLIDDILQQVQAGQVSLSDSAGAGIRRGRPKESRIETAYLQLVLTKLWDEERRRNSFTLHASTLHELGGADNIVKTHVNSVMNQLASDRQRDIAANMFRYLVTPSRSKIAQATKDLVSYAERPDSEVEPVLKALTDRSEYRILRRIADPEQYEIFHDVLAQPLLDWRRSHAEALAASRAWFYISLAGAITIIFAALAVYALIERNRAKDLAMHAKLATEQLLVLSDQQQQIREELKNAEDKGAGNDAQVASLKAQLQQNANQTQQIGQTVESRQEAITRRDAERASSERDDAVTKLTAAQTENTSLKSELAAAQQKLSELQNAKAQPNAPAQAPVNRAGKPIQQSAAVEAKENENDTRPLPPTGLTASVDGGPSAPSRANSPPITVAAGTVVCGNLWKWSQPTVTIMRPPALFGDVLEGQIIKPTAKDPQSKALLQIEFEKLSVGISSFPIVAVVTSATSKDKNHPAVVGENGSIAGLESPSLKRLSEICITIKKTVTLTPSK